MLARLWGALAREPVPGIRSRERAGPMLTVTLDDGRRLCAESDAAEAFAVVADSFAVELDGTRYTEPGDLVRAWAPPGGDRLAAELDNSVANLALARAGQPAPDGGPPALVRAYTAEDPLAYLEQCVVDGHPLHPCCRTRIGPVHGRGAGLCPGAPARGPARPGRRARPTGGPAPRRRCWRCTRGSASTCWTRYPFLSPTGRVLSARPLMSLRTVAVDRHRHVKTAVDVQMTSAVRTVSPAAVHNGPVLSRLLAGLTRRTPTLSVLPEPEAGIVLVDGAPEPQPGRRPPHGAAPGPRRVGVAAGRARRPVAGRRDADRRRDRHAGVRQGPGRLHRRPGRPRPAAAVHPAGAGRGARGARAEPAARVARASTGGAALSRLRRGPGQPGPAAPARCATATPARRPRHRRPGRAAGETAGRRVDGAG